MATIAVAAQVIQEWGGEGGLVLVCLCGTASGRAARGSTSNTGMGVCGTADSISASGSASNVGMGGGAQVISSSGGSNDTRDQTLPIMLRHIKFQIGCKTVRYCTTPPETRVYQ